MEQRPSNERMGVSLVNSEASAGLICRYTMMIGYWGLFRPLKSYTFEVT